MCSVPRRTGGGGRCPGGPGGIPEAVRALGSARVPLRRRCIERVRDVAGARAGTERCRHSLHGRDPLHRHDLQRLDSRRDGPGPGAGRDREQPRPCGPDDRDDGGGRRRLRRRAQRVQSSHEPRPRAERVVRSGVRQHPVPGVDPMRLRIDRGRGPVHRSRRDSRLARFARRVAEHVSDMVERASTASHDDDTGPTR